MCSLTGGVGGKTTPYPQRGEEESKSGMEHSDEQNMNRKLRALSSICFISNVFLWKNEMNFISTRLCRVN